MSLPSRQLFLDRFMEYNRIRYKDDPDKLQRLESLTLDDIVFEGLSPDPTREGSWVSNFSVPQKAIEAYMQRWIPAKIDEDKIIDNNEITVAADLASIVSGQARGFYRYTDPDTNDIKFAIVMNFRSDLPVHQLATEIAIFLNNKAKYRILSPDLHINWDKSTDDYKVFDLLNETIAGEVTVVRLTGDWMKGTYFQGYLGEWVPEDVIRPSVLASMLGLPAAKIINGDSNWLKFSHEGKILYIAKQTTGKNISWSTLLNIGAVNGERIVDWGQGQWAVKLIDGRDAEDSEWNRLIYRIHQDDPTGTFWEKFTNAETDIGISKYTLSRSLSGSSVYARGSSKLITQSSVPKTNEREYYRWRPVLRYLGVSEMEFEPNVIMDDLLPLDLLNDYRHVDITYACTLSGTKFSGTPAEPVSLQLKNFVYNVMLNKVVFDHKVKDMTPAENSGYRYDAVKNASFSNIKLDTVIVPAEYRNKFSIKDVIIRTGLSKVVVEVEPVENYPNGVILNGFFIGRLTKTRDAVYPVDIDNSLVRSDNTIAVRPVSGLWEESIEFNIESIVYTGASLHIPETNYSDVTDDEVFDPATSFMSF